MNIYELIGIILGDGYLGHNKKARRYWLQITGNITDKEYFNIISKFMFDKTNKKPLLFVRKETKGESLRLELNNRNFISILINKFGLNLGEKTFTAQIPKKFLSWRYSKHIIRGIFDTDGSLFFSRSKKKKYPTYPRLEIKTSSRLLAKQVIYLLEDRKFNVHSFSSNHDKTIRIYLSGNKMLEKWIKEISFTNPKNMKKYLYWKKRGYYVPRTY